jgi:cellulose synthase (UDP-forming)
MAFHLILPTLLSLISPRLGKFNVTDKGDLTDRDYFDAYTVRPLIITVLLMVGSMIWVGVRYYMNGYAGIDPASSCLTSPGAALAPSFYWPLLPWRKRVSRSVKRSASTPVCRLKCSFSDGSHMLTRTVDISMGGARGATERRRPALQSSGSD